MIAKTIAWGRLKDRLAKGDMDYPCPSLNTATTKELNRFWEELHYYQPVQLDDLIVALKGGEAVNTNTSNALKKLEPLFSQLFGWDFETPKFIKLDRQRKNLRGLASTPIEEEADNKVEEPTMNAVAMKSKNAVNKKPDIKSVKKAVPVVTKKAKLVKKVDTKKSAGGIGEFAKGLIKSGMETDKILVAVKKKFPDAKTTANNIAFYRYQLKNDS